METENLYVVEDTISQLTNDKLEKVFTVEITNKMLSP